MGGFSSHKKVPEMPVVREPTYSFTNLARSMNGLGQPIKKTNETAAMHSVMGTSIDFLKKHSQNKCAAMLEKLKDNVETDNNAKAVAFAYCNLAMQYMQSESIWKKHEQEFKIAYTKADESEKNSLLVEYQNWLQAYNNYANVFVQYYTDPFSKESEKKFSEVIVACNVTSASFARASSGVEIAAKYRTELRTSRKNAEDYLQRVNELIKVTDEYADSKEKKEKMQFLYAEKMKAEHIISDIGAVYPKVSADKMYVLGNDGEYHANMLLGTPVDSAEVPQYIKDNESEKIAKFQKNHPDFFIPVLDKFASAFKYKNNTQKQDVYDYLDVICWKELFRASTENKDEKTYKRAYESAKTAIAPYTDWSELDQVLANFRFSEKDNPAKQTNAKEFMMSSRYDPGKEAVKLRHVKAWNALMNYDQGNSWSMKKVDGIIELYGEAQAELSAEVNIAYKKEVLGQGFFRRNTEVLVDVGVGAVGATGSVLAVTGVGTVPAIFMISLSSAYFAGKGTSGFIIAAKEGDAKGMAFSGIMTVTAGLGVFGTGLKMINPVLGFGKALTYTMGAGGVILTGNIIYESGKTIAEGQQFGWTEVRSMELASNSAFLLFGVGSSMVAKKFGAEPQKCKEIAQKLGEMKEVAPGSEARAVPGRKEGTASEANPKPADTEVTHPARIFKIPPEVRAARERAQAEAKPKEVEGSALHPPAQGVEAVNARIAKTSSRKGAAEKPAVPETGHPIAKVVNIRDFRGRRRPTVETKAVKPTEAKVPVRTKVPVIKEAPVSAESYRNLLGLLNEEKQEYVREYFGDALPSQTTLQNALILFGDRHGTRREVFDSFSEVSMKESMGGNAGAGRSAVNGYYDPATGQIIAFGNIQNIPPAILARGREFSILQDINTGKIVRIIGNNLPASLKALDGMKLESGLDSVRSQLGGAREQPIIMAKLWSVQRTPAQKEATAFLLDANYVLNKMKADISIYETIKRLAAKGTVIMTRAVYDEIMRNKVIRDIRSDPRRIASFVEDLYRAQAEGLISIDEIAVPAQAKQDMKAQMRETSPKGEGNVGAGEASIVYYINSHLAGLFGKIVVLTADKDVTYLLGGRKGIAVMPESP